MQRMDLLKALPHGTRVEGDVPDETRYDRSTTLLEIAHLQADTADVIGERLGQMAIRHLGPGTGAESSKASAS